MDIIYEISLCAMGYYSIGEGIKYKKLFELAPKYELLDRLYRRYVRYEDINSTRELVEKIFAGLSFDEGLQREFFDAYDNCVEDVERYVKEKGMPYGREDGVDDCPPIRIINTTDAFVSLYLAVESLIPLEDYDNHEGAPFWMYPSEMMDKYSH